MGQQQILLLLLTSIIVGLAILLAINISQAEEKSLIEDQYTELLLETASNLQAYWHKPSALGGGNHFFEGATFDKIPCLLDEVKYSSFNCQTTDERYLINLLEIRADSINIAAIINLRGDYLEAMYTVKGNSINVLKKWGPL